jgi:hypothetical protein
VEEWNMTNSSLLIAAMAEECRARVAASTANESLSEQNPTGDLPTALQPEHLDAMCQVIVKNAEAWPETRLHRWIGFIQGGMLANRIIDIEQMKAMFDQAELAYGELVDDLIDHLDCLNPFELDLGGQG